MRVLLIAPNIDGTDVGESFVAFKWAEALASLVDLTVLSFQRPDRPLLTDQLPGARVVTWTEPGFLLRHERLNAMLKPGFPVFSAHVRRWLTAALQRGETFDIAHQLMPQAARYTTPFRHFDIPYVIGPLGGALETPAAFGKEVGSSLFFTRLRALDGWRLRYDPWLRVGYRKAALVLGVAPYMADTLKPVRVRRFEPLLELGIDRLAPHVKRPIKVGCLRLLHVGRAVRTKGLRDVVRALGHLRDMPGITLTSAGSGEEIALCKAEAEQLGVADRVTFLGRVPRSEIEKLYETHDVFAFPSYREPAGGVLYEAMRWGLPIITARRGGPEWIVDDASGLRILVTDPETYAKDIADAVRRLAHDPELRQRLGSGARAKVGAEGLWPDKATRMVALYRSVLSAEMVLS
jgi:glycosyltransferase involved in cell wall biosynthesis